VADGLSASYACGELRAVSFGLLAMSAVSAACGEWRRAIVIEAAAKVMARRADIVVADSERTFYERVLAPAHEALGADVETAASEGAAMTTETAVRFASTIDTADGPA
jgi:hypothetical protein